MDTAKRSKVVILTLIGLPVGVVALANILPEGRPVQRNLYADRAACERDYTPQQCEQHSGSAGAGSSSTALYWRGPYYYTDRTTPDARSDPGMGRTGGLARASFESSTRGGFGGFAHAARAGS